MAVTEEYYKNKDFTRLLQTRMNNHIKYSLRRVLIHKKDPSLLSTLFKVRMILTSDRTFKTEQKHIKKRALRFYLWKVGQQPREHIRAPRKGEIEKGRER